MSNKAIKVASLAVFALGILSRGKSASSRGSIYWQGGDYSNVPWQAVEFIGRCEGRLLTAYYDVYGWSIAYGNHYYPNGVKVKEGDRITESQAEDMLRHSIGRINKTLSERIPNWSSMNNSQRSAIISFAYNVGSGFYGSPNFEAITNALANDWNAVPLALEKYVMSGGKKLSGLVRRRKGEGRLWRGEWKSGDGCK